MRGLGVVAMTIILGLIAIGLMMFAHHHYFTPRQAEIAAQLAASSLSSSPKPVAIDALLTPMGLTQVLNELLMHSQHLGLAWVSLTPEPEQFGAVWTQQRYELQWLGSYGSVRDILAYWADAAPQMKVLALQAETQSEGVLLTLQFEVWLVEV